MATPPLNYAVRITDDQGRPTPEFVRLWQSQHDVNSTIPALSTAAEVGTVLDHITATTGAVLYRSAAGWLGLSIGTPGKVLTAGTGGVPEWDALPPGVTTFTGLSDTPASYTGAAGKTVAVNAGATGLEFVTGAGSVFNNQRHGGTLNSADTTAVASVANCFTANGVMRIYQVMCGITYITGCTYAAYIATVSGGGGSNTVLTLAQIGSLWTPVAGYGSTLTAGIFTAATPYTTTAGTDYAVIITRTDSTTTTATRVMRGTQTAPQPILGQWNQSRNAAVNPPVVGSTLVYYSALAFDIWIGWA